MANDFEEFSPSWSPTKWLLGCGGLVVVGLAVVVVMAIASRPGPPPQDPPPVDTLAPLEASKAKELLKLRYEGIGELENGQPQNALPLFNKIVEQLAIDPLGHRNRLVAYEIGLNQTRELSEQNALEAVEQSRKSLEKDPLFFALAGRIDVKRGQFEAAAEHFRQATKLAPEEAHLWFALYDALITKAAGQQASPERDEARNALLQAHSLAKDNVWIIGKLLPELANQKSPEFLKNLTAAKPHLLPMKQAVALATRLNLEEVLTNLQTLAEKAEQSQQENDWKTVSLKAEQLFRLYNSLPMAQSDRSQISPHSLDFLIMEFNLDRFGQARERAEESQQLTFKPFAEQLPEAKDTTATALIDFDIDGHTDVVRVRTKQVEVWGRPQSRGDWKLIAEAPLTEVYHLVQAGDLDHDAVTPMTPTPEPAKKEVSAAPGNGTTMCSQADPDLVLLGVKGVLVLKNEADATTGIRKLVAMETPELSKLQMCSAGLLVDFDHEGDLDLVIASNLGVSLWANHENLQFVRGEPLAGFPERVMVNRLIAVDFDRDVDIDILAFGPQYQEDSGACGYLENLLHGDFRWRSMVDIFPELVPNVKAAAIFDGDQNRSWDLILAGPIGVGGFYTNFKRPGVIEKARVELFSPNVPSGMRSGDFDNDGLADFIVWNESGLGLQRGMINGKLTGVGTTFEPTFKNSQDVVVSDLDRDGDLDLGVLSNGVLQLLTNEGGNKNHWVDIRLRALQVKDVGGGALESRRVNHQGVGSQVELRNGIHIAMQVAEGDRVHFGLGNKTQADGVRIVWTNGVPQDLLNITGDREVCEQQANKGSCPFLYTWNGKNFEFFTDLLWNAPLGLQFAKGVIAQPRAWEYLKIPGSRMVPRKNQYVLQITEELWEAGYFDEVELLAVDHPADVQIFTNEKVGPPDIAAHKIHTVREPRPVISAKDGHNRDVWSQISQEDGEFTKTYDKKYRQGLVEEHSLELDLGDFDHTQPTTLFLTGWMYPTDTSINVGVSQNKEVAGPRPPALWAIDESGKWREVRPFMGFPGGKTKTIAVDLAGVFATKDHRLKIVTNMEFYWDHIFFSTSEKPAEVRVTPLKLWSAELHERGFSAHSWEPGNGPDRYNYRRVKRTPQWPPMQGYFTRYGEVTELLSKVDDMLVVMGAGDEMTLTFEIPNDKPVPEGWKRDFIIHNTGWDKDADLNTLYGQTVEPLPFQKMSGYPYRPDEAVPDSPEYHLYLRTYQTREQPFGRFWRSPLGETNAKREK